MFEKIKPAENPFDPVNISKETATFNNDIENLLIDVPPLYLSTPEKIRENMEAGIVPYPIKRLKEVEDRTVPGPAGDIPIRVYRPENVKEVYLDFHGGGFALGQAYHKDIRLVELANKCDVVTISVDYRLAPENPFPAGLDDCEAVAEWLLKNAKEMFGTEKLTIGGDSTGANLSVATLIRLRNKHSFTGFLGANLVYGMFDLMGSPSVQNCGENSIYLTTKLIKWFTTLYVSPKKLDYPEVSPLYANLIDLPPAIFTVGTFDPLLDDSLFMHSRWIASGNEGRLNIATGGIHHFDFYPKQLRIARQANSNIRNFIRDIVNSTSC